MRSRLLPSAILLVVLVSTLLLAAPLVLERLGRSVTSYDGLWTGVLSAVVFVLLGVVLLLWLEKRRLGRQIAGRQRYEKALEESELQFRHLFEHSVDALLIHDGEGRIVDCNAETCRSLGYSHDELLGMYVKDFATDLKPDEKRREDDDSIWSRAQRGRPGEISGVHLGEHRRKDGTYFPVEVRVSPIDYRGRRLIFASARDITDRRDAERELVREREFLGAVLDNLTDSVVACDAEGNLTLFNQSARSLHGTDESEAGPESWGERYSLYDADGNTPLERDEIPLYRALSGETFRLSEMSVVPPDGSHHTLLASGRPFYDEEGRQLGAVVAMHDITERKVAEREILEKARELERFSLNLKELHRLSTTTYATFDEFLDDYLVAGCRILGLETGILKRVQGGISTVRAVRSDLNLQPGTKIPLQDTYCSEAVRSEETVFCNHVGEDDRLSRRPAYQISGQEAFISVPIWVDDEVYGTLHFSSGRAQDPFENHECEIAELIARGIGRAFAKRQAERELRETEDRYRSLIEQIPAITYIDALDDVSSAIYMSPQCTEMLGYTPEEWTSEPDLWIRTLHPDDRERAVSENALALISDKPFRQEYRLLSKDGRIVWVRDEGRILKDRSGEPLFWQGVIFDITEQKSLEGQLSHQAFHDTLTGLPNRALFRDRVEQALSHKVRSIESVAILFLDLDNFKFVNDSLGHEAGDELLCKVGQALKDSVRPSDTIARLGGDEFAVLLENVSRPGDAVDVAERILNKLQVPFDLADREFFVNASIGIASGSSGKGGEELMRNADMAMYEAKKDGKARHRIFDLDMELFSRGRLELETALHRALGRNEFRLHYQPEVTLEDGRVVGFEALLRWQHPDFGTISPEKFIPLAEELGLIVPIGRWVLLEACRQAKRWQIIHDRDLLMSVNLSARQFQESDFVSDVRSALRQTELSPESLVLEITESIALNDTPQTIATLEELNELGIGLAIDDFGTGYSSLSYLRNLSADFLKLDRSFIERLGSNPNDTVLVSGVINLAQNLGLQVIAEGVEDADQVGWLRDLGCDLAQGYYFKGPVQESEASSLMKGSSGAFGKLLQEL